MNKYQKGWKANKNKSILTMPTAEDMHLTRIADEDTRLTPRDEGIVTFIRHKIINVPF